MAGRTGRDSWHLDPVYWPAVLYHLADLGQAQVPQPAASQRCDDSDMEGLTRSHHDSFYVLPPEEERLEVGSRHLKHRLSVISEVSEESSPASSPLTSPQRIISSLHSQTPPGHIRQSYQDDFLSSEEFR